MKHLAEKAAFHKALSEPVRLKIIEYLLKRGECTCLCEFSRLVNRDQSVVSRHVQILKNAGIIRTKSHAKYMFCCLKDKEKIKRILEG